VAFLVSDTAARRVTVSSLQPAAAAARLAATSSVAYLLDPPGRAREFQQVVSMAARVPCAEITRPSDTPSLDEVLASLDEWIAALGSTAPLLA
jgi:hypothetical protein